MKRLSPKPRQNAIMLLTYLQSILDYDKMIEENGKYAMEVYQSGMTFFEEILGNSSYVLVEPDDIAFMKALKPRPKHMAELTEELSWSMRKVSSMLPKALSKGFVTTYSSKIDGKQVQMYKLTKYGEKRLYQELEQLYNEI